uniref:Aminopeptidase n=1 Tax=Terrapene triunguis TaxID=2587831 RepID=A0A674IJQ5_9SAUR
MDFEDKKSKRYCMKKKHVAIICAVVAAVGLAVGLGVGLSRPEPCQPSGGTEQPATTTPGTVETRHCPPKNDANGDWTDFRLPTYINPEHYELEVKPVMDADIYTGTVNISIKLGKPTKYLWLHLRETKITELPMLWKSSGQQIALIECFEYEQHEYVVMEAKEMLSATTANDNYILTLKFQGWLNGSLVGFYRTTYTEKGVTKSIAATDHEPTDARKSFPCFDEPNKKATYTISIIHKEPFKALANMPVEVFNHIILLFAKYNLICFVQLGSALIVFLHFVLQLRIYAQPQQIHTAEYAANVTKVVFDYFEQYFDMNYSLPKLDKIAIPDFGTGAMENWGLITYRETNLLYDPKESASSNKQRVAAVIAHELVHQWFGNIVTMDWWDDLWLNEGFASYFEFLGVNAAETNWQMVPITPHPIPFFPHLLSGHPTSTCLLFPLSIFISLLLPWSSILRMLQDWITPANFQKGCQEYLKKYQFQNAKTDDFWESLAQASGKPVKEVMDTWTRQMGYPVLSVAANSKVTQRRFLLDPSANSSEPTSALGYTWNIPVKWRAGTETNVTFYNKSVSAGKLHNPDSLLKINPDHIGFYRVNYETQTWNNISRLLAINHTSFSSADRAGLLDDVFSLARAELLNYAVPLNLTKYLPNEEDYLPWHRVISAVSYLRDMLGDDIELYPRFKTYFRSLVKPIANKLGWNDDETGSHVMRLLRADVLGFACSMDDQDALNNASSLFYSWLNGASPSVNLRLLVYRYGMQNSGNETSWNYMFQKYQSTSLAQEKEKLLYGLASVKNITLLDRLYLKYIYNTSLIKSQDVFTVLRYISYNSYGKTMAWDWIRLNWEYLVSRYTINDRNLGRIVSITQTFNTDLQLWQMENFFEKYPNAGAGKAPRKQALETVKNNIEWLKQNKGEIEAWLTT